MKGVCHWNSRCARAAKRHRRNFYSVSLYRLFGVRFGLLATRTVKVQNHPNFVAIQLIRRTSVALLYKAVPTRCSSAPLQGAFVRLSASPCGEQEHRNGDPH
jgi:hypothetical protein